MTSSRAKLALYGGDPVRSRPYPTMNPFGDLEKSRAMEVLDSGVLSGFLGRGTAEFNGGPCVLEFETAFAERFGVEHAISMNSASSGLHAAMVAAGIGPGDEVITTPYTMSATSAAIVQCGATPVYADIEPDTFCIEVSRTGELVTDRTRAILAVNLFGLPSDLLALRALAEKHGLLLVEDNAQAPLASQCGRLAGSVGHMSVFSLNRHKTMQVGEGGVVVTDDEVLAERLRLVRNHGECALWDWGRNEHTDIAGCNYRLTEIQATLATPQIGKLSDWNEMRQEQAGRLDEMLNQFKFLRAPQVRDNCTHVYYLYAMTYESSELGIPRDKVVQALRSEGIHAANYHVPLYRIPVLRSTMPIACPVVEEVEYQRIIVTKICQPPCASAEVEELRVAIGKIFDNAEMLRGSSELD